MRLRAIAIAPVFLFIAACGGQQEPPDTTAQSCGEFFASQSAIVSGIKDGRGGLSKAQWDEKMDELVATMDAAGLNATDPDVKQRIGTVVETVPVDVLDLGLSKSAATKFNTASVSAARACTAAGSGGTEAELSVHKYMGP